MDHRPVRSPAVLRPHHPPAGGREDCWSEGATEALVEAWGERYVQLGRGNLRQKDWQEVADAVNEHQDAVGHSRRTDIQCKNRVDTLKKKYKAEKSKRGPSIWPFFSRLDDLISIPPSHPNPSRRNPQPLQQLPPLPVTLKLKNRSTNPQIRAAVDPPSPPVSSESSRGVTAADRCGREDSDEEEEVEEEVRRLGRKRRRDGTGGGASVDEAFRELAKAMEKLGEVYERVEAMKQRQMMELEKQRMDFAKELEIQRMQMFVEAQMELEKMKKPRGGGCSNGGSGAASATNAVSGEGLGMALVLYLSLFMGAPTTY